MIARSKKAFTLLELIVVVVVLGILAALAIPSFSTVKQSAADKVAFNSAASIYRNAQALAAFDGATVDDTHINTAGAEATGFTASSNAVSITSGGKTGTAYVCVAGPSATACS
jgi:type IV pilus assembly protein PilA